MLVNVHGNSATATKLQTARTIALSGDVTGSASFNGSANVTITTNLANVAVLTGTIPANTGNNSYSSIEVNYPSGYNQNNCVIVASQFNNGNANTVYSSGTILNVSSYTLGGMPAVVSLNSSKIQIKVSNVYTISGDPAQIYVQKISVPIKYKIMLMKI